MSAPIPVLINAGGGSAAAKGEALRGEVEAAFAAAGLAIDLHLLDGKTLRRAIEDYAHAPLVVVGGGDGTLGCAAQALVDHGDAVLGILPLGTHNHLAKELGVPAELDAAVKLIAERPVRHIDLARVGGRVFVNNASIGFYPEMVREREAGQKKHGLPKWLAAIPAAAEALRRLPHHRLHLDLPQGPHDVVTPMLFVGNNRYTLQAGAVGSREALDGGVMSIFAVASRSRWALIGFALRTLAGRADRAEDFAAIGEATAFTADDGSSDLEIAIDGEVVELDMPLEFRIEPGALAVVAPAPGAQAA